MKTPKSFYEIELKTLLTEEQFNRLHSELPKKMKLINTESIHTTRYRPGDVRLRHSDKTTEIVCKDKDPTTICRKEIVIPLGSIKELEHFSQMLDLLEFKPDPPWLKHKKEFEHRMNGYSYVVCLQHIEKFAYIMEVEFLSQNDDSAIHEPNLRRIIKELGCEPIEPKDFADRINQYIQTNRIR